MAKIKVQDDSNSDSSRVVSPTQAQMDDWIAEELAEAEQDQMLTDEAPATLFSSESID